MKRDKQRSDKVSLEDELKILQVRFPKTLLKNNMNCKLLKWSCLCLVFALPLPHICLIQSLSLYQTNRQGEKEPNVSEPPPYGQSVFDLLMENAKYFNEEAMSSFYTFINDDETATRSISQAPTTPQMARNTLGDQSFEDMQPAATTTTLIHTTTTTPPPTTPPPTTTPALTTRPALTTTTTLPPPPSTTTTITTQQGQATTQEEQPTRTTTALLHLTGAPPVRVLQESESIVGHMRHLIQQQKERDEAILNDIATNMEYDYDYDAPTVEPELFTTEPQLITEPQLSTSEPQQLLTRETISNNETNTETSTSSLPMETTITIGTNAAAAASASSSTIGTAFRGTLLVALLLLLL